MSKKPERFSKQKDAVQKYKWTIVYLAMVLTAVGTIIGFGLLPAQVSVTPGVDWATYRPKEMFLLMHLGMASLFSVLFAKWPREWAYLAALVLSVFLVFNLLYANL